MTEQELEQAAKAPKRVAGDAGSAEQHSLTDQIAADRHLANKKAGRNKRAAIFDGLYKGTPPGADE